MTVRTALQIINQELDAYLAEQEGDLDVDTRFCLTWFEQHGMSDGPFGEADVLARARNTSVDGLVDAGVLRSKAGKVRLLTRSELAADWDPIKDRRLTVWECTQQLIRVLNMSRGGEEEAGKLVARMGGGQSEEARALAYRLYTICERKKWPEEAIFYNTLVISWPAIQEKAAGIRIYTSRDQKGLDLV
jgi:putative DNA methylase